MKKALTLALVSAALLSATPAQSQTINFEGIGIGYPFADAVSILGFYNGGTSSVGTSGPNYGIQFSDDAVAVCLNSLVIRCGAASRDGIGDPNSRTGAMVFAGSDLTVMNRVLGFTNAVTFQYVASSDGGTAWAWSGLNGTGMLLGSVNLPESPNIGSDSCLLDYAAFFCPFSPLTLNFQGTARSIVFTGVSNQAAIDDISFQVAVVPEPSTVALLGIGLATLGVVGTRRKKSNQLT